MKTFQNGNVAVRELVEADCALCLVIKGGSHTVSEGEDGVDLIQLADEAVASVKKTPVDAERLILQARRRCECEGAF